MNTSTDIIKRCDKCQNPMAIMKKYKDGYDGFKCFKCKVIIKELKGGSVCENGN